MGKSCLLRRATVVATVLCIPPVLASPWLAGCGDKPNPKNPVAASGDASASGDAAPEASAVPTSSGVVSEAGVLLVSDALPLSSTSESGVLVTTDAAPAGPCWKGFAVTGNAVADVGELGKRCAAGMTQPIPTVKHVFKQGEKKSFPVLVLPGCYRIIAVGGTGVKDVDLELTDNAGKLIAADNTPDDIMPMLHPNKELCIEGSYIANLSITVKKGAGEVAGGVWKR